MSLTITQVCVMAKPVLLALLFLSMELSQGAPVKDPQTSSGFSGLV